MNWKVKVCVVVEVVASGVFAASVFAAAYRFSHEAGWAVGAFVVLWCAGRFRSMFEEEF